MKREEKRAIVLITIIVVSIMAAIFFKNVLYAVPLVGVVIYWLYLIDQEAKERFDKGNDNDNDNERNIEITKNGNIIKLPPSFKK